MRLKWFFIIILLTIGCNESKKVIEETLEETEVEISNKKLDVLAKEQLGEKFATLKNATEEYTIAFTKYKDFKELFATVKFFVYEHKTESIILEDELISGVVKWHSEDTVVAIHRNSDETETYYFNVVTKKKS